ncbi:frizzled-8-like [Branchiostoma floridae x Branchiostoma belcheri]
MGRADLRALAVVWLVMLARVSTTVAIKDKICEEVTIPMCKGIYNYTYMPNKFHHQNQEEAGLEVHQFWPLVEIQCSPALKFFLCSMYAPICLEDYDHPLPVCKNVCQMAKDGCAPIMSQYQFAWPERFECDDLPEQGDPDRLCMHFLNASGDNTQKSTPALPTITAGSNGVPGGQPRPAPPSGGCKCGCNNPLVSIPPSSKSWYNRGISAGDQPNCGVPCYDPYFDRSKKTFAKFWIALWAGLCCASTFMTVTTFLIDMTRFKYPERPIIFLALCYFFVSLGYIIRLIAGHEAVACEKDLQIVRYGTTGPALCTIVFLLIYFFSMASSIWWVILSFTWFLAAGMKWGQEAIASYAQYFHLAAWLIPSVKTIAVLAMSSVDGDPVSGICYVGNQNLDNLRGFVLAPLMVYLIIGTSFLLAGFVSLIRIRKVIKQGGTKTDKLEKLMLRIGIFSVLYTVPATIVVACYFYEQQHRPAWERALACPDCMPDFRPDYTVFMLKYFMCLVVGVTSGVWVWTGKTIDSWKQFHRKLCGKKTSQTQARYTAVTTIALPKQTSFTHV